ncbi:MFS transporter [Reyranella sp. MMS21-HV4-11]|uniref:MFS transporter n=1 Tax=Reyranella humidisoli TaxID=2849149 RepID=A0ABS6IIH5_9HYPH|nr:MFS transporter [Reyranella sp. MMS21-HV4-11]
MKVTAAAKATVGLCLTQIVGWGTTFLMPSVLGRHFERDLDLPSEVVYGGITVMFGVGALFAPRVGRLLDRTGARSVMAIGSIVYALSLAALSFSQGLVSYLLCWAAMGIASTLALNTPASIALAQIAGSRARQAIAVLAIIGGFASTVFWPLSEALETFLSWRGVLLVYAAIHLLVCAPVHLLVLPGRPKVGTHAAAGATPTPPPSDHTKRIFLLLAVAFSCGAFIFTGFIVHAIGVMRGLGHDPASALLLASLIGPAQVAVRVVELVFGHRYAISSSTLFAAAVLPLGLGLAFLAGGNFAVALLCLVAYGIANGLKAVLRATLPLALFGRAQFGTYLGRLALPQGIVSAAAPPVLAAVMANYGAQGVLAVTFVIGMIALVATVMLVRASGTVR